MTDDEERIRRWYGDGYSNDAERAAEMQRLNGVYMGMLLEIANLIKPHVSTRFVEGDSLADSIEQVLHPADVNLRDTQPGVEVFDAQMRLRRIAAWYVHYRNDEGGGYGDLDGFFGMLGMTQEQLTEVYYSDPRLSDFEAHDERTQAAMKEYWDKVDETLPDDEDVKVVRAWLNDDEQMRVPDTEWGKKLYDAVTKLLAEHDEVQ